MKKLLLLFITLITVTVGAQDYGLRSFIIQNMNDSVNNDNYKTLVTTNNDVIVVTTDIDYFISHDVKKSDIRNIKKNKIELNNQSLNIWYEMEDIEGILLDAGIYEGVVVIKDHNKKYSSDYYSFITHKFSSKSYDVDINNEKRNDILSSVNSEKGIQTIGVGNILVIIVDMNNFVEYTGMTPNRVRTIFGEKDNVNETGSAMWDAMEPIYSDLNDAYFYYGVLCIKDGIHLYKSDLYSFKNKKYNK